MNILDSIKSYTVEGTFTGYYETLSPDKMKALKVVSHFNTWKEFKMSSSEYPYRDEDINNSNKDFFIPHVDEYDYGESVYSEDSIYTVEYDQSENSFPLTVIDVHGCKREYFEHLQAIYENPYHYNDNTLLYELYLPEYSRTTLRNLPNKLIYLKICGTARCVWVQDKPILYLKCGFDISANCNKISLPKCLLYGCFSESVILLQNIPKTIILLDIKHLTCNNHKKFKYLVYLSCMYNSIFKHHMNYESFNIKYLRLCERKTSHHYAKYVNGYLSQSYLDKNEYYVRDSSNKLTPYGQ